MKLLVTIVAAFWLTLIQSAAIADNHVDPAHELLMVRVSNTFPEAMNAVQQAVVNNGYKLMRVQRVDVGLTASGSTVDSSRTFCLNRKAPIVVAGTRPPTSPVRVTNPPRFVFATLPLIFPPTSRGTASPS